MISSVPPSLDLAAILIGDEEIGEPFPDDELIPARMLNEFTYCPRLAYLEWVQGEFSDNLETRQGTFGHRNVDKPTTKPVPEGKPKGEGGRVKDEFDEDDEDREEMKRSDAGSLRYGSGNPAVAGAVSGEPRTTMGKNPGIHIPGSPDQRAGDIPILNPSCDAQQPAAPAPARALTLSAPLEGLVAKLDVLEFDGAVVVPVDYKRGSIPDNEHQAWEPERVQLCAQGLILRENGYTCEHGELYYIESRRRVVIPFDDVLVMRTRELVKQLRAMGKAQKMPPPLIDSPKCPRCSLVGICLPDETNLLLHQEAERSEAESLRDESRDPCITEVRQRANNAPILNPSCDAHEPAVPDQRANDAPILNPSCDAHEPAVPGIAHRPAMLVPARDDALPLYVKEQGSFVGKDGDRIVVRHREAKLISVPLMEVSQVSLFGNVQMSAQALREIVDRGIPVCHFSYGGWFNAMTTGHVHKNIELRIAQFATAADPAKSLALAKGFIMAKMKNCRTMLRRHGAGKAKGAEKDEGGRMKDEQDAVTQRGPVAWALAREGISHDFSSPRELRQTPHAGLGSDGSPSSIQEISSNGLSPSAPGNLEQLAEWIQKAERAISAATLLGLEGMAAKVYFAGFSRILKGGSTFVMHGRNRRPPRDPINAVLSFVYALLTKEVTIAVQAVGFDPMLGFFHRPRYGRPSLALDLAEEFRPIIADSTAMMVINNGEVNESSFIARAGAVALNESGRKSVIAAFERRMEHEITHPIFGYKISYRRVLEVQARLLSRVVLGELKEYPGFCTR